MIKKIVAICDEFDTEYSKYQPWNIFYNLGKSLNSQGIEFVIVTNKKSPKMMDGIPILQISEQKLRKFSSSSMKKILSIKPDLIIWMGNPLSGIYIVKNDFGNIPVFLLLSTIPMLIDDIKKLSNKEIVSENFINLFSIFTKNFFIKKLNNPKITGIITTTNTIKQRLLDLNIHSNKIHVMPLCFDSQKNIEDDNLVTNPTFTMCYLGSFFSIRGVFLILDVLKKAKEENFNLHLKFLLRSNDPKDLSNLHKASKARNILDMISIKHGILESTSVLKEIRSSDVIILPPKFVWNEPPLAILESMSLGKPVVTTDVCSMPEIVNDFGICAQPNANSLFQAIKYVFENNSLSKKMSIDAQEYVYHLPCWEHCSKWILNTLDS